MGHRSVPHTADMRIEAWAATREACIAEAVAGAVASFADLTGAAPGPTVRFHAGPAPDADLLAEVLDEVVYRVDAEGLVPLAADVSVALGGGLDVELAMAGTADATPVGAVPKAVSLHELRLGHDDRAGGWSCSATLDV